MGYDAECTLTMDGRSHRGTAILEPHALVFRGDVRLMIPLTSVASVRAHDGVLSLRFGDRAIALALGAAAERWAHRITHPPSRLQKLGVKPGMRAAILGVDDADLEAEIVAQGATVERGTRTTALDMIFYAANTLADLARLEGLKKRIQPAGAIWVIRRKGKAASIGEADSMAAGKRAGLVDVKVVSFSDTHSAEKYVIPVAQRAGAGRSSSPPARTRGSASAPARTRRRRS